MQIDINYYARYGIFWWGCFYLVGPLTRIHIWNWLRYVIYWSTVALELCLYVGVHVNVSWGGERIITWWWKQSSWVRKWKWLVTKSTSHLIVGTISISTDCGIKMSHHHDACRMSASTCGSITWASISHLCRLLMLRIYIEASVSDSALILNIFLLVLW